MTIEALGLAAVNLILGKTVEGALTTIGTDAYKAALNRLKGFLTYKFAGRPELEQIEANPKPFEDLVEEQASQEEFFRRELESLINQVQEAIKNAPATGTSYSDVETAVTQNLGDISRSTVAGRDATVGDYIEGSQQKFQKPN